MANGDIRGLDISSAIPTQSSRYQAPQVQAPNISSGYGELAGAYDYATKAVLKGFEALGSIAEDHLELERSNRWTEKQNEVNQVFQQLTLNSDRHLRQQDQSALSWNEENGERPVITTINNYLGQELNIRGKEEPTSLNKILQSVKDDSRLHNGIQSYINSKSSSLMTEMINKTTQLQIKRGADSISSSYETTINELKSKIITTHGLNEEQSQQENWTDGQSLTNWKKADEEIENNHFQAQDEQVINYIARTGQPANKLVNSLNNLRQTYMEGKFLQEKAVLGKTNPELLIKRYNSGYYNMKGKKVFIDKNGNIQHSKVQTLTLDPKNIHRHISELTSDVKVKNVNEKKKLHLQNLLSLATQSDSSNIKFKSSYAKYDKAKGVYVPNLVNIQRDHSEFQDATSSDLAQLQAIVDKAYNHTSDTTGKTALPKKMSTVYNAYAQFRFNETTSDTDGYSDNPLDLYDLSNVKEKDPDFEDIISDIDEFFDQLIPSRPDKLAEFSLDQLQESIVFAKSKPPPYAELGTSWSNYISTLENYLNKKQGNVSDAIMQETGIFYNLEKPISNIDLETLNQKNIEFNGKAWSPSTTQMDTWGNALKPLNKGGSLDFRFDTKGNRVDTILGTKEMIIGLFEDRGKGEEIWQNVKKYWASQGGDMAKASALYDYWEGPDAISDTAKVTLIEGLNAEKKNSSIEAIARKWDRDHDTYLDKIESINQRTNHINLIVDYANSLLGDPELESNKNSDTIKGAVVKAFNDLGAGEVHGRVQGGNVISWSKGALKQYANSTEESGKMLKFAGNAMIGSIITKKSMSKLFPEIEGEKGLEFGGKKLFGYTKQQEEIIIDALLTGTFEGLKLTVVNDGDGFAPALFQENPFDSNSKGWTVYVWHDEKISKEEFENKYMVSRKAVQFLERLEGVFGQHGNKDPYVVEWNVNGKKRTWKLPKPLTTGKTYKGMLEIKKELENLKRTDNLPPGISADSWFPTEWYSPGKAELQTINLIDEKLDELVPQYLKKKPIIEEMERYKKETGKDMPVSLLRKALYPVAINKLKEDFNSWKTRVEKAIKNLTVRKVYLEDGHVKIEDVKRSDPVVSSKATGMFDITDKEVREMLLKEKGLLK